MEGEDDLLVENTLLRQLLVEAGLHAAEQDVAGKLQRLISEEFAANELGAGELARHPCRGDAAFSSFQAASCANLKSHYYSRP